MMNNQVFRGSLTALAAIGLCAMSFSFAAAQQGKLRIIQTNSAGDNIHIIDPVANKVVGEIKGIEAPHGIAVAPDGSPDLRQRRSRTRRSPWSTGRRCR